MKYIGLITLLFVLMALNACGKFGSIRAVMNSGAEPPCDPISGPLGGGSGDVASPFLICSVDHLMQLYKWSGQARSFVLRSDLDVEGVAVTPVPVWAGVFDGRFHSIHGWSGKSPLFGKITGRVSALLLTAVQINAIQDESGAIASEVSESGVLENVSALGSVTSVFDSIGGLVGVVRGELKNSWFSGHVSGGQMVGGAVGKSLGLISRVSVTAVVHANFDSVGGAVGHQLAGKVELTGVDVDVSGRNSVGGLIGLSQSAKVENSYALGTVTASASAGGLVGSSSSTHFFCLADTYISAASGVGGLVGTIANGGDSGMTTSSYWNVDKVAIGTVGQGKTRFELGLEATYQDWDFDSMWFLEAGELPRLFLGEP